MTRTPVIVLISLVFAVPGAWAEVWYVDATVPNPGDGQSWAAAFEFLQDALEEPDLAAGDEIRVAAGTYLLDRYSHSPNGTGDRLVSFELQPGVALYGGFPPGGGPFASRDPAAWPSVLSGDIFGFSQDPVESCGDLAAGAADCFIATPDITGCVNSACCSIVCDVLLFCCVIEWDEQCVIAANFFCEGRATVTALGIGQNIRIDGFTLADGKAVGAPIVDPYLYYGGGMRAG